MEIEDENELENKRIEQIFSNFSSLPKRSRGTEEKGETNVLIDTLDNASDSEEEEE